ncbi:MAG TPA: hypothetical protein P5081_18500 [Phycisphaerae bacterium]|nr:hypothetical protein [Phycisphaerae bacterium]HRW54863.1 hypothetical protein [Phycisphaerae bacterium]
MNTRALFVLSAIALASSGFADNGGQHTPASQPSTTNPAQPKAASQTSDPADLEPPSIASLTANPVIGSLGLPLGTVAEIRATIVDGDDLRMKAYQGAYLLRVTNVDGRPLEPSRVKEFSVPPFIGVKLANDDFRLHKIKTGAEAKSLDANQVEDLKKGYVGKEVRLAVYETGAYSGMPRNLSDDVPVWQSTDFVFSTWLVILADRSSASPAHANVENTP